MGSVDELVSWRDIVDAATGQEFVYFEVPFSDHVSVIDYGDPVHGAERKRILQKALDDFDVARGSAEAILPWDTDPILPDEDVRRVVFVIHGIRDEGHWTQKIASRSRRLYAEQHREDKKQEDERQGDQSGDKRKEIAVVTSSYGYFSMLQFLLYPQRWSKVRWLVEQYVETRRRYPKAKLSYIGHSNGTYLAAHALERFPAVKFERLAFAGSVVSSRFDWPKRLPGQVSHVLNYGATADWVVGIFPRLADVIPPLRLVFGPSLGGAGIAPFQKGALAEDAARTAGEPLEGVLVLLLTLLPALAWSNPARFWVLPLILLLGTVFASAAADATSRLFSLGRRGAANKAIAILLLIAVVAGFGLLCVKTPLLGVLAAWSEPVCGAQQSVLQELREAPLVSALTPPEKVSCEPLLSALRTLSCVFYFVCIYLVLTRV